MEDADFGDLCVQRVTEADFDDIVKFLRTDFLHNEPLNRSINLAVEDTKGLFDGKLYSLNIRLIVVESFLFLLVMWMQIEL